MPPKKKAEPEPVPVEAKKKEHVPKGTYAHLASPQYREEEEWVRDNVPVVLGVIMRRRKLTMEGIGKLMGLSPAAVRHRVYGRTEFTVPELVALARELELDPAVFYDRNAPIEEITRRESPSSSSEAKPRSRRVGSE